ncbi:MAG: hypothetical protein ACJAUB_002231 [Cryomorphaceae bacterium]|jgi:hypothetical protein
MGGEGYGYPPNFSSTSKPKRKDRNTEDQFFETKDVVVEEKVVATIALDKLLQDVMENEISQCVVVHSADTNSLFYSSEPRLISPTRKFECEKGDSIATRFVLIFSTENKTKKGREIVDRIQWNFSGKEHR